MRRTSLRIISIIGMLLVAACVSTPPKPEASGMVHFSPHEGDMARTRFHMLTPANEPAKMRFCPGAEFDYDKALVGSIGKIVCEFAVNADGNVDAVRVLEAIPANAAESVAKIFMRAKFRPASVDGKPVACRIAVEQSFKL